jgi:nicotinamide mononucleotide transporter
MIELIGWLATLISVIGIVLNAKKIIYCWPIWLLSNVLWITYFVVLKNYPSIVLWIMFSIFNVYGWLEWNKLKNK